MSIPPSALPRYLRSPGDEGYRTPTIEDVEGNSTGSFPFPPATTTLPVMVARSRLSIVQSNGTQSTKDVDFESNGTRSYPLSRCRRSESWPLKLPWRERIRHFTWAFFTLTMATGGLANVLYCIPYRFRGLDTIGIVVFLLNIAIYLILWALMALRFYLYPYTFKASFLHPTESLFAPAVIVSFGTILINIAQYGPPRNGVWLDHATEVLFWFDAALSIAASAGVYLLLWSTQTFTISQMTPIWIFPAYPLLIVGPHAAILSGNLSQSQALRIIIGGTTIQGIGFLVSLTVYSAFIYRLMTQKLPKENLRPGMFVSVGPSAFTVASMVGMGMSAERAFAPDFMGDGVLAAKVMRITSNFAALWLWGLAIFFFIIAVFANFSAVTRGKMLFSMAWYSFVFPNTALVTATFAIGKAFASPEIEIAGCVMTIILFLTYFFVTGMMVRAIRLHHILWPQKGEDKDEGGFRIKEITPEAPTPLVND
ncbi:hypothetical protein AJ80_06221 [Polytolypa hystricis UAMH7299]|uniref:C4-dicarboxylate transporter/malic acid transporter n=1 Tax=Polytolypa hystricis (strain UAMH7299) TaxID=1447883 RepID=A0A2B7XWX0_POLH7|nr:hypothetical protein AJ80_06221 [Polytolypa hystricis UAMH7299]